MSSQVQHLVALGARRLKTSPFIIVENCFDDRLWLFDDSHQVEIACGNHAFADQLVPHPGDQSLPEFAANQNDRYLAALAGLDQRQALGQLIDGAEASRQHYVRRREAHEHHLAREEIAKVDPDILEAVAGRLVRKKNVETNRGRPAGVRAAIGGFHQTRTAAGNYRKAGIREEPRDAFRFSVIRMVRLDASAAEHAYRRPYAAQTLGRDGEFCYNAEHPPRLLAVRRVHRLRVDYLRNLVRLNHA